jgi:F420-dependent oxidoreductase-like protein
MKLGLQIPYFTWPGGASEIGIKLAEIAKTADDAGFDSIWVMDHFFQIPPVGPPEMDMLEAYTTLGYLAGQTSRVGLGTMVTGVTYRNPGVLVKQVTTLDVVSGGRAWLGIGAAWFDREHSGLGVSFPPLRERFERLEDVLQIAHQMWSENNGPFEGKHYQLAETINVPQVLSNPHPRILIGGTGEKKTLRLVAKYADACNIPAQGGLDFVQHKLSVLREHCDREGRAYNDIEKTVLLVMNVGPEGERSAGLVEQASQFADIGVDTIIGAVIGCENLKPLEVIGRDVIPQIAGL